MEDQLRGLGQFREISVEGVVSLAYWFPPEASRCGIYILTFRDGARYVGQSLNVVTRFGSHRRRWPDVTSIAFMACPREELGKHERAVLSAVEAQGHSVRNIDLAGRPGGDAVLDLVIEKEAQAEWVESGIPEPSDSPRYREAVQRCAGRERFDAFMARADAGELIGAASVYVAAALPWASQTEGRFWNVTVMPSTGRRKDWKRLICINAQNAEVLVIGETLTPTGPTITGFLNADPRADNTRIWLRRKAPDAFVEDAFYGTIGQVARIHFIGLDVLETLLHDGSPLIDHARQLALNLMRKGPSMYAKYHNHHVADEIFQRLAKR